MTNEFKTINNRWVSDEGIVNEMIGLYHEEFESGRSPINDFTPGSQTRNPLESVTNEAYPLRYFLDFMLRMGFVQYAKNQFLDLLGEVEGFSRETEKQSVGYLVFTWESSFDINVVIPQWTRVQIQGTDLEFETVEDNFLSAGETSIRVLGQSVFGGTEYNVKSNVINLIIDDDENNIFLDATVTNPEPFTGGNDKEEDDYYRARILEGRTGKNFGTIDWHKQMAEKINGVHDVAVINQPVGRYTVGIIVNGNQKPTPDILMSQVRDWFYQQENLIGGMDVLVKKTNEKPVSFQIIGTAAKGQNPVTAKETINNDLRCLIEGGTTSTGVNYLGFDIGDTLYLTQVYDVLRALRSILPTWYINIPDWDITARSDEILVFGEANIQI